MENITTLIVEVPRNAMEWIPIQQHCRSLQNLHLDDPIDGTFVELAHGLAALCALPALRRLFVGIYFCWPNVDIFKEQLSQLRSSIQVLVEEYRDWGDLFELAATAPGR